MLLWDAMFPLAFASHAQPKYMYALSAPIQNAPLRSHSILAFAHGLGLAFRELRLAFSRMVVILYVCIASYGGVTGISQHPARPSDPS